MNLRENRLFQTMEELGRTLIHYSELGYSDGTEPIDRAAGYAYLYGVRPSRQVEEHTDATLANLYAAWKRNYGKPGIFWKKNDGPRIWRALITIDRLLYFDFSPSGLKRVNRARAL